MFRSSILLSALAAISLASPLHGRSVTTLDPAAFEQAQRRDNTATRAFSSVEIKTSDGQCLFVDKLSGDFRANLNPIEVATCDGSEGQKWDIITAGEHNDQLGTMLVVNTLTQACMNFDDRRPCGSKVIMFSCGGRADGDGTITDSQLFSFAGGNGPLALEPKNAAGTCFTVNKAVIDNEACNEAATQQFTIGGGVSNSDSVSSSKASESTAPTAIEPAATTSLDGLTSTPCTSTVILTVTRASAIETSSLQPIGMTTSIQTSADQTSTTGAISTNIQSPVQDIDPTEAVPVSRAGGVLNPSAAAQANERDETAVRAFSSVSLQDSAGKCLFVDPTAGDFRQNLIPINVRECTGSAGEKFDLITSGKHNNIAGTTLIVSSLTQGCVNFDDRRVAGDTVIMFSCGGRADGDGQTTNSQVFPFDVGNKLVLSPKNADGKTCLIDVNGRLDSVACTGEAGQSFSIV